MGKLELRRHGDILFKTETGFKIPTNVDLKLQTLVHRGENHDHYLTNAQPMGELDGKKYLRILEDTFVDHAEHGKNLLSQGDYWIEIQTEYDHLLEESRAVID